MAEMTEPEALALPPSADPLDQPPDRQPDPPPVRRGERRGTVALVVAILCVLALAAGAFWVARTGRVLTRRLAQVEQAQQAQQAQPAVDPAKLSQLDGQVAALRGEVAKLEAQPQPAPTPAPAVDLKPLEDRIAALEQRPATAAPDDSALQGKVQGLLGQLGALTQQVQSAQDTAKASQEAAKAAEAQAKASQEQSTAAQDQAKTSEEQAKAAQEQARNAQNQASSAQSQAKSAQGEASTAQAQTSAAADRVGQAQQLQVAAAALDAGRPLGDLPGAPTALTRFATTPPPTEAALRLSFPAAARQAAEASRPSLEGESLLSRMWTRAQSLVTVKQGGRVVVGAPAAATLAEAQQRLDAGDLGGTLRALQALDPAAAAAMAPWREQAQALVDARASLAASVAALAHR